VPLSLSWAGILARSFVPPHADWRLSGRPAGPEKICNQVTVLLLQTGGSLRKFSIGRDRDGHSGQ
jgi:hypothetical protein